MKIWVDDVRPAPEGYIWFKSVNETKHHICVWKFQMLKEIELLDLDHDAGDYAMYGGDYIEILNWLEEQGWSIPIRLHTMNPVGRDNMRRIIEKNGWQEVL